MSAESLVASVTTVASVVAVLVAVYAVVTQNRQSRITLEAQIVRELSLEFSSDGMMRIRLRATEFLLAGSAGDAPSEVFDLLDFFDAMSTYFRKGVVGKDMAWSHFYYWLGYYWNMLGDHAHALEQSHGAKYYREVQKTYGELTAYAVKEG